MEELSLWPTLVLVDQLELGRPVVEACVGAHAKNKIGATERDADRWAYDLFADPETETLRQAAKSYASQYLLCTARDPSRFEITVRGWINSYAAGEYIFPHTHESDLTAVWVADDGDGSSDIGVSLEGNWTVLLDPRGRIGAARNGARDPNTRHIASPTGTLILHPGSLYHYQAPHNGPRPRIVVSINIDLRETDVSL